MLTVLIPFSYQHATNRPKLPAMTDVLTETKARKLIDRARRHLSTGNRAECRRLLQRAIPLAEGNAALILAISNPLAAAAGPSKALRLLSTAPLSDQDINGQIVALTKQLIPHLGREDDETPTGFLVDLLEAPGVSPEGLFPICVTQLLKNSKLTALARESSSDGQAILETTAAAPLLIALISNAIAANPILERLLTSARRAAFQRFLDGGASPLEGLDILLTALARQNFLNEYCHALGDEKEEGAGRLIDQTLADDTLTNNALLTLAALRSCYAPLSASQNLDKIERALQDYPNPPPGFTAMWREQIEEPREEKRLAADIGADIAPASAIEDDVSRKVRDQYEVFPYPRWSRSAYQATRSFSDELRAQLPALPDAELEAAPATPEILIAGGGTGQHPVPLAGRVPEAQMTVVDLSLTSLAYAKRKANEQGLSNITFAQADILGLADWERRFDVIESVGVLHHMRDPMAGWRVLSNLLRPGGWMKIGLYSHHARGYVRAARSWITDRYGDDAKEMRRFRNDILSGGSDHPLASLTQAYDFYSLSNCRDMFFHVQEHQFTIPQIAAAIEDLGLEFMGFQLASAEWFKGYAARHPEDPSQRNLTNWDRYETEDNRLFGAMYAFWLRKPD